MRSAYYQVPLPEEDRPFTAFEADRKLWQYTRVPFGATRGFLCFQREMDNFVTKYELNDIFPYIDNVTICGGDQGGQDIILKDFRETPSKINSTLPEEKFVFSVEEIDLLCDRISHNSLKHDPNRLEPLISLPAPTNQEELKIVAGTFSYYAKWINQFPDKIRVLNSLVKLYLNQDQVNTL